MPNQGFKIRSFRFPDDKYERLLAIAKSHNCKDIRELMTKITEQDLIVIKNFSKNT